MRRRHFLAGLVGASAASGAAVARGDRGLHWSGWLTAPGQIVVYGYWVAQHRDEWVVSTTRGQLQRLPNLHYVFDLSLELRWPALTCMSPETEREAVKARAKTALLEALA